MENEKDKTKEYESILRKSLKEIEIMKAKLADLSEPIAIIGMSCRFPGNCNTPKEYWNLISNNVDGISDIPADRWKIEDYYDADPEVPGKMYMRKGGFITQKIDEFDARLFNISPTEAIDLDPQQRLLLELAWEAFENADIDSSFLVGSRTGVFLGLAASDYVNLIGDKKIHDLTQYTAYSITGTISCMASGRISHFFGLQGPAISLDTACSSSLVATYLACESIHRNECDMALAGGINLNLSPLPFIALSRTRALAADGHCKTFDARGDGYGRSEGGGLVLLKRLSLALKDNDRILAVFKGGAINQDGPSSGLTVPNGQAQELLLKQALKNAHLSPHEISYLEAHGTGTALGDPIEMNSVSNVLGKDRNPENPLYLGAVKSNIGHTESAAGVAGIIKAVLCLQNKKIPPMKVEHINPRIDLGRIPAIIPDNLIDWEPKTGSRNIGVSAFALSGTNAHLIISEAPSQMILSKTADSTMQIFTLSSKSDEALKALIVRYSQFLEVTEDDLADIAYSANIGRRHFPSPHRIAFIADSKASLKLQLDHYLMSNTTPEFKSDDKLGEIARAYKMGSDINWKEFYAGVSHQKVSLPNYPFQRKPHWIEIESSLQLNRLNTLTNPLFGMRVPSSNDENIFLFQISLENLPEVLDVAHSLHIGFSQEMLLHALTQLEPVNAYTVQDMSFVLPLLVEFNEIRSVVLTLIKDSKSSYRFKFQSYQKPTGKWSLHIQGTIMLDTPCQSTMQSISHDGVPTYDTDSFYKMLDARTMFLGPSVRLVDKIWVQGNQLVAKFFLNSPATDKRSCIIPLDPAVFDTCAQVFHALLPDTSPPDFKMMVLKLGELSVNFSSSFSELWCHFKVLGKDPTLKDVYIGEFVLLNEMGECIAQCHDFKMKGATDAALKSLSEAMTRGVGLIESNFPKREAILRSTAAEKAQLIQEVLLEELSRVLTLTKNEINPGESINNLGMDSIMGITFKNAIQNQLGADLPLEEIVQGPNLETLTALVLNLLLGQDHEKTRIDSQWFMGHRKPQAKFRLFCLPYGGAGASIYRDWQNLFSDEIDVCPIQLPGRESRIKEPPYTEMAALVEGLTTALRPMLDCPFAFFGHSYGALVAYELTKSLQKKYQFSAKHIFVSAFTSPTLSNTRVAQLKSNPRLSELLQSDILGNSLQGESDRLLWAKFFPEIQRMPIEMQSLYIKIGLADLKTVEGSLIQREKIDCGLTAFWGTDDNSVPEHDMLAWQELCQNKIKVYQMKGEHLFMNDLAVRKEIIRIIEDELTGVRSRS